MSIPDIIAAQRGDPKAMSRLVADNLGLLYFVLGRIGIREREEWLGEAALGFIDAVQRYDTRHPTKSKPSTFFVRCMTNWITRAMGNEMKVAARFSTNCDPRPRYVADAELDVPNAEIEKLMHCVSKLPKREQYIVKRRMMGDTFRMIARDGLPRVTHQRAKQIHVAALEKLRELMS